MKLIDESDGKEYTLQELHHDWKRFSKEDPDNHFETFKTEFFEILMATINDRNDCEVIGLTNAELNRYILKLRSIVI